jgi:hypothetical protein
MKIKNLWVLFICLVISCNNISNIVPIDNSNKIGEYHCFPYEVSIYDIQGISFNEVFYQYPNEQFCNLTSGCELIKWMKFSESPLALVCDE